MNATIPEPLQNVVDQLSMPSFDRLPSITEMREHLAEQLAPEPAHRSRKPLLLLLLAAGIVTFVLMRRRASGSDTEFSDEVGAPVTGDAAFVDAR